MKTALLVIDVQRALFEPAPRPFEADAVIQRINTLSRSARDAGSPVVFIQHECVGTSLEHESVGWQLATGLEVQQADLFIRKRTPDSFLRTPLQQVLETHHVRRVVVAGYASEFCVDTTSRRAAALGLEVVLAADAHTTHDKDHASAEAIRNHENATLPAITSFGPPLSAIGSANVAFAV